MKQQSIPAYAREQTRSRLKRFRTQQRRTEKHLSDPESIHDLRVSMRRYTQCLRMFRGLFAPGPVKKIRRRMRKLMELCAAVRNCDVAVEVLRQASIDTGPSGPNLGAVRKVAERRLRDRLERHRRRKKSNGMTFPHLEVREGSEWAPGQSLEENLATILPSMAEDLFTAGNAAAAAGAEPDRMHRFRLRAKRFRYALELFPEFYGVEIKRRLDALGELQDRLGAINDCVATIVLLGKDEHAVAAVRKLLRQRETEFRRHWKDHYSGASLASWKKWLSQPRVVTEGPLHG